MISRSVVFLILLHAPAISFAQSKDSPVTIKVESNRVGQFDSEEIDESSGVIASVNHEGMFWTHNDNGDDLRLFLVEESGKLRAIFQLKGVEAKDVEDISAFQLNGNSRIVLGDIGDNGSRRKRCQLFVFDEPKVPLEENEIVKSKLTEIETIEFSYEDGSRNCESMAVDSETQTVWLATKESLTGSNATRNHRPGLYRLNIAAAQMKKQSVLTANRVASLSDPLTTGMDISADNKTAVIRTYTYARLFHRVENETWEQTFANGNSILFGLPTQIQGEAICFLPDTNQLLTTSEQPGQPIWRIRLPDPADSQRSVE